MPASGTYRLAPLAEADLEAIWLYTVQAWSVDQADIYLGELFSAFDGLAKGHKLGRPVNVRAGYIKYLVGAHVVYFRLSACGIDVIRILHQSMDVERHLAT